MHMNGLLKRRPRSFLPFLLIILPFLLCGCGLFVRPTAVLWTSVPEFASYTEVYNLQQDTYKIELVYKEDPVAALLETQNPPDIVVAKRLVSVKTIEAFASVEKMFKDEELNQTIFYPQLLEQGVYEGEHVILPVSFKLPMIIFRKDMKIPEEDNLTLTYKDLWNIALEFKVESEELPELMSFVPSWEPLFLFYTSYLLESNYRESSTGELLWNARKVNLTISELQRWSSEINNGTEMERQFTERYLYNPGYKLINTGRILFYFMDIEKYFNIPEEKRDNLDFRWYGKEQENPISDTILYLGLPKRGKSTKAAKNFIQWFFTTDTQQELLENAKNKRIRTFGIAEGFSSLIQINEREIPRFFPEMTGRIIPGEYISVPPSLPPEWDEIKEEVLVPWFRDKIVFSSPETLEDRLNTWYKQLPSR